MKTLMVDAKGHWQIYWGPGPLPAGAEALGTVSQRGETGALILLTSGIYMRGNAGALASLPQNRVAKLLDGTAQL